MPKEIIHLEKIIEASKIIADALTEDKKEHYRIKKDMALVIENTLIHRGVVVRKMTIKSR